MRKIFSKTCGLVTVLACMGGTAYAQTSDLTNGGTIIIPDSSSSTVNSQGFNLPTAPRATGQDIIRGSGGVSCQSAIGGNGPTLDMGFIGSNDVFDRESAALFGRVTMQLGKKAKRVDCNRLYDLEVERLKMELALLRAGSIGAGAGGGYGDPGAVRSILAQGEQPNYQAPVQTAQAEEDLPESASISPFKLGGPNKKPNAEAKAKPAKPAPAPDVVATAPQPMTLKPVSLQKPLPQSTALPKKATPEQSAFYIYDASKAEAAKAEAAQADEAKTVRNKIPALAVTLDNIGEEMSDYAGQTYFAQMGAFSTLEKAQAAWTEVSADVPTDLPGGYAFASPVVRGDKTLYLLQAGPYPKNIGRQICKSVKSDCFAVRG